ncbi:MAG TPA: hypothetical protein VJS92_11620 [Candidatus Polarisedimenticolaceae bacterium]|nr:hypothetical protein [Candidatus Polarisedimenticolaceae bacterium]
MEAKVDIRKLQILNDRINQTLDALNQVRVSVHGLGQSPYGMQGGGLGHTSQPSFGQQQPQQPWGLGHSPFSGTQQFNPFGQQIGGLYHSPEQAIEQRLCEQRASDPQRLMQTFPFAFANINY